MTEIILRVVGLKTYFHTSYGIVKAVDGVTLEVPKGEIVGIVGESGSGKSVTALSIMRLIPSPGRIEGRVLFENKDLLELTEDEMRRTRGGEIAMVFQDPATYLNPVMRVGDQIAEAMTLHEVVEKEEVEAAVSRILADVNIPWPEKIARFYPHELSGGMKQRVLIAMALSCNARLVILDEPTTALDNTVQVQILNLLMELKRKSDLTFVLITHDLGIVAEVCDRVYVMYGGKIMESGDVFSIFKEPANPYLLGLLDSILSIDEHRENLVAIEGSVPDLAEVTPGCRFYPRCPRAMPICSREEPPLVEVKKGHHSFCWIGVSGYETAHRS